MTTHDISMADVAAKTTMRIRVIHTTRVKLRLWLFGQIIKAAVVVCPMAVEVEAAFNVDDSRPS